MTTNDDTGASAEPDVPAGYCAGCAYPLDAHAPHCPRTAPPAPARPAVTDAVWSGVRAGVLHGFELMNRLASAAAEESDYEHRIAHAEAYASAYVDARAARLAAPAPCPTCAAEPGPPGAICDACADQQVREAVGASAPAPGADGAAPQSGEVEAAHTLLVFRLLAAADAHDDDLLRIDARTVEQVLADQRDALAAQARATEGRENERARAVANAFETGMAVVRNEAAATINTLRARLAEAERESDAVSAALSQTVGPSRFLDPPDGGDVPLPEQVRRMGEALAEAERRAAAAVQRAEDAAAALRVAAAVFEEYAKLHRAKRTREGDMKADSNKDRAFACWEAAARAAAPTGGEGGDDAR